MFMQMLVEYTEKARSRALPTEYTEKGRKKGKVKSEKTKTYFSLRRSSRAKGRKGKKVKGRRAKNL
jgi:hypothetical protein